TLEDSAGSITVGSGSATLTMSTVGDFAHTGWHLVDVTYDGSTGTVVLFEDGQAIGTGTLDLGSDGTSVPGQGLRMYGNAGGMGLDEVAMYATALSPARIDAHWSVGEAHAGVPACAAASTAPYATTITADNPLVYYRLDELSLDSHDRLALDSSSHCANAAYQ